MEAFFTCGSVCICMQPSWSDSFWHVVRVTGLKCDIMDKAPFKGFCCLSQKKKPVLNKMLQVLLEFEEGVCLRYVTSL